MARRPGLTPWMLVVLLSICLVGQCYDLKVAEQSVCKCSHSEARP